MQIVHRRQRQLGSVQDALKKLRDIGSRTGRNLRETYVVMSAPEYSPSARDLLADPDAEIGKAIGARAAKFHNALQSGASLSPFLRVPYPGPRKLLLGTYVPVEIGDADLETTSPILWAQHQALTGKLQELMKLAQDEYKAATSEARQTVWFDIQNKIKNKYSLVNQVVFALATTMKKWPEKAAEFQREFASIPLKRESVPALKALKLRISEALQNIYIDHASAAALLATINGWISQFTEGAADLSAAEADAQLVVNAESMGLAELLGTIASIREKKPELAKQLQTIYDRRKLAADQKAEEEKKAQQKKMLLIGGGVAAVALVLFLTRRKSA